jgi:hypothetical protein
VDRYGSDLAMTWVSDLQSCIEVSNPHSAVYSLYHRLTFPIDLRCHHRLC